MVFNFTLRSPMLSFDDIEIFEIESTLLQFQSNIEYLMLCLNSASLYYINHISSRRYLFTLYISLSCILLVKDSQL